MTDDKALATALEIFDALSDAQYLKIKELYFNHRQAQLKPAEQLANAL